MTNIDGELRFRGRTLYSASWDLFMTIDVLGPRSGLQGFSRQYGAQLFSVSVLVLLITASALAGTKPSQPTASRPVDVTADINRSINKTCPPAEVVKDQPVRASQTIPASGSAADAPTTSISDIPGDADSSKTGILQDKLWSTSLSRSSQKEAPKAPQCGTTAPGQPPEN